MPMPTIEFDALDYHADQRFVAAHYLLDGDQARGWQVHRDGKLALELGPGYRLLRTSQCGICSTDLARHFLPFPLPQVIGHEVIAKDEQGRRYVVEINASHEARGVASDCAFCAVGLATHCPERLVLGIHDLPGGFGPWILAPIASCLAIPDSVPDSAAVLVEPFAAALHGVQTIAPRAGDRIAVLGPRRLGMLVVAALAGVRAREQQAGAGFEGRGFEIAAVARDPAMLPLATSFGATETHHLHPDAPPLADQMFDVVVDTTGNPDGLATAVRLARREVHLKSTHGQPACGLAHLTELVVDELSIEPFPDEAAGKSSDQVPDQTTAQITDQITATWHHHAAGVRPQVAWLAAQSPPQWLEQQADVRRGTAVELAKHYAARTHGLPRADVAVVDSATQVDAAIRPESGSEQSLVRPRGAVLVHPGADVADSVLLQAVVARGLRLTSSRCGDFRSALDLLAADTDLCRIGERLITHRFTAGELKEAFAVAGSRACVKAVVTYGVGDA
ncbi:MAG: threonine dehydrogenase-like Zn-dependent dehydrogenase [Planctomycetota bacterium]|jgi:threonine dehydrogenase-like Zn-dependent dehydrogenase